MCIYNLTCNSKRVVSFAEMSKSKSKRIFSRSQNFNITTDAFVRNNEYLLDQIIFMSGNLFLLGKIEKTENLRSDGMWIRNMCTGYAESELRSKLMHYKLLLTESDTISIYITKDRLQPKVFSCNIKMIVRFSEDDNEHCVTFYFGRFKESTLCNLCLYKVKLF